MQGILDDEETIVRRNDTARAWMGHPELPVKLGFCYLWNEPNRGGLPDPAENRQASGIEDIIDREVDVRTRGMAALVITTGVMREFVFYIPVGVNIRAIHDAVRAEVTTHEMQCMAVHEPNWDSFRFFLKC